MRTDALFLEPEANMGTRVQFSDMNLDDRLLKGIAKLGWANPTEIQTEAIPLLIEGKDVLVTAQTGTGKTAVFAIPIIQKILQAKQESLSRLPSSVKAVVLAPSKELCTQIAKCFVDLCQFCLRDLKAINIAVGRSSKSLLADKPDVIVSTPSQLLTHLRNKTIVLNKTMEWFVVDEADLIFSYGYEDDIRNIMKFLPTIYQACLTSATLLEGVLEMKSLLLHNPVTVKVEEAAAVSARLTQYHIRCQKEDKFLLIYSLLKLRLITGKTLIFVNTIDSCYCLKLFLEQFSIASCVVNSELPHNSRCHIVEQFNRGIYDIVIAVTDELSQDESTAQQSRKRKRDREYGISRGIDFQHVDNIVLFDFPLTLKSYIHCIGRTARGEESGTTLSFVCSESEEERLEKAQSNQKEHLGVVAIKPYQFKMSEIEGFRYRAKDALSAVTKTAVRQARLKEIKTELLTSDRLKTHFEDNPRDLQILRHDQALHPTKVQQHMKHVPTYLVPKSLRGQVATAAAQERGLSQMKRKKKSYCHSNKKKNRKRSSEDPLRTFDCIISSD
ncbi:probable ATP-dependent RNA helicase DDX56 isoform X2 [Dysidea avara]|uniref:probable ATP-dependent RNA helicase DDX56 isoform X2 n=1 Tax=Dysidea avara TaxID=196820 RepID=UPI003317D758